MKKIILCICLSMHLSILVLCQTSVCSDIYNNEKNNENAVCNEKIDVIENVIKEKIKKYKAAEMDDSEIHLIAVEIYNAWVNYGIRPSIILSIIETESSFNYKAIRGQSVGLMQITPQYTKEIAQQLGINNDIRSLLVPLNNIRVAIIMLNQLKIIMSDQSPFLHKTLAAYNMGPSKARRIYTCKKCITPTYVKKIIKYTQYYHRAGID